MGNLEEKFMGVRIDMFIDDEMRYASRTLLLCTIIVSVLIFLIGVLVKEVLFIGILSILTGIFGLFASFRTRSQYSKKIVFTDSKIKIILGKKNVVYEILIKDLIKVKKWKCYSLNIGINPGEK